MGIILPMHRRTAAPALGAAAGLLSLTLGACGVRMGPAPQIPSGTFAEPAPIGVSALPAAPSRAPASCEPYRWAEAAGISHPDADIAAAYSAMVSQNRKAGALKCAKGMAARLTALTLNLGLLNGAAASVPEYGTRSTVLERQLDAFLKKEQPDLLFFQELWYQKDFATVNNVAAANGYLPAVTQWLPHATEENGVQFLVKASLLKPGTAIDDVAFDLYLDKDGSEIRAWFEKLGGYDRGLLSGRITLRDGSTVLVGDTHFTAMLSESSTRLRQVDELTRILRMKGARTDFVLMGADFNSSPEFENASRDEVKDWQKNTASWLNFREETGLVDAFAATRPGDPGYTSDRRHNALTCASSTTRIEPEQRIDFVWSGSFSGATTVSVASKLVFTDPLKDANGRLLRAKTYYEPGRLSDGSYDFVNTVDIDPQEGPDPDMTMGSIFMSDHFGVLSAIDLYR